MYRRNISSIHLNSSFYIYYCLQPLHLYLFFSQLLLPKCLLAIYVLLYVLSSYQWEVYTISQTSRNKAKIPVVSYGVTLQENINSLMCFGQSFFYSSYSISFHPIQNVNEVYTYNHMAFNYDLFLKIL